MSHVYVAEEKEFGRRIVVKVLPLERTAGVSVERFKREIKVAARLQHPHIVPVLTAGQIDGLPYYTMPFVKGESLRARLARSGELSINDTLHYLRDVASALAYAHSEGVVHRDIKPDNVIVSGGVAVVTDFGVAKAVDVAATDTNTATGITSLGVALGTPAYMAPEQASADPRVDHRADIYSFGCLAYELLAGSSPFAGRPAQQMLAAHVTDLPEPLLRRRPQVPPALAALVMKCLEKRPGDRPQTADEIVATLDAIATPSGGMIPTGEKIRAAQTNRLPLMIAGALVLAVALVGAVLFSRARGIQPYSVGTTTPIATTTGVEIFPAISPDGKVVAYAAMTPKGGRIFVRQLDGGRATMLTDEIDGNYVWPSWSPDGSRIAFNAGGAIYVIPALTGGTPKRTIENASTSTWSRDGKQIIYATGDGIYAHDLGGGGSKQIIRGTLLHSPAVSPDGRLLAYGRGRYPTFQNLSANAVFVVAMSGGTPIRVSDSTHVNLSPIWAPDGKSILYVSNLNGTRDVVQQAVSSDGRPNGNPQQITTSLGSWVISLSSDGSRMAYDAVRANNNIYEIAVTGTAQKVTAGKALTRENQHVEAISLSNDGNWLAYDSDITGNFDIYKLRLGGGDPVQVTTNPANDFAPSFSPDDKQISFHTNRNGTRDIYVISSEGTGEQQVTSGGDEDYFPVWPPDGNQLAFWRESEDKFYYEIVSRSSSGKWGLPRPLGPPAEVTDISDIRWSPDGTLIALTLRAGIGVVTPQGSAPRIVASNADLGGRAQGMYWAPDSKSIYVYANNNERGEIWNVPLDGAKPRLILSDEPDAPFGRWLFATDGKRLFYTRAAWEADVWVTELKRK